MSEILKSQRRRPTSTTKSTILLRPGWWLAAAGSRLCKPLTMAVSSAISHPLALLLQVVPKHSLRAAVGSSLSLGYRRTFSVSSRVRTAASSTTSSSRPSDPSLVAYCSPALGTTTTTTTTTTPTDWDDESAVVYPDVISAVQEQELLQILAQRFRRYVHVRTQDRSGSDTLLA
jgi:hypothetical protein